jgi:hypothetical protein
MSVANPNAKQLNLRGKNHRLNMIFDKKSAFFMFSRPIQKDELILEAKNMRTEMEVAASEQTKFRMVYNTTVLSKEAMGTMLSALLYYGFWTGDLSDTKLKEWADKTKQDVIADKEMDMVV